jgi:putative heme-binding domain-containing protein
MTIIDLRRLALACLLMGSGLLQAQEHSYAPSDIENGRGLYQANCLGCHGDNGSAVEGSNLASGRFRRASSDEDLIALIRTGIPSTLMIPRPQLAYGELRALVAFLRSMQTGGAMRREDTREVAIGDAARGEQLFFGTAMCSSCHGVNGGGSPLYQDLKGIGAQRSPASLEQSILDPMAEVREGQRFYQVTALNGQAVEGKLMNQDRHSIQLLTMDAELRSYRTAELSAHGFIPSPMPANLDVLSATQVADLVAYLLTLKE